MNAINCSSHCESDQMCVPKSNECESTNYTNIKHTFKAFDVLQSLRKYVVLCFLKSDDDTIVFGYAVEGAKEYGCLKSVEVYKPSSEVWISIADMQLLGNGSSVIAPDGFLYVVGGYGGKVEWRLNSFEIYDPSVNSWSMEEISKTMSDFDGGIIVDKALVTKFYN